MSRRLERVADLLRAEISHLLQHRLGDPRVALAVVSEVRVSPDLRRASVLVSVLGGDPERQAALAALDHARGFVRSELARSLRGLKRMPELSFELDRSAEYSQRMSDLLESLHDPEQGS